MKSAALVVALAAATPVQAPIAIEAPGPKGPLAGTLTLPRKDAPIILMIPGSGPTDRDGNSPLGIQAAPYRLVAEGLAQQGIGTVRIDKRGMFGSKQAVEDANAVTLDDYVRDTAAWVAAIRVQTNARCVWLLGHSEGGLVALKAAATVKHVCGIILVATPGRPLAVVLREQLHANPANAPFLPAADAAIEALSAGKRVDDAKLPPALLPLFNHAVQGFLISTLSPDPAALISRIGKPIIILQGQRDLQVSITDAERLKRAAPDATLAMLPDTNHVLKQVVSDERATNLATYAASDLPLAPGVVDGIARFIQAH